MKRAHFSPFFVSFDDLSVIHVELKGASLELLAKLIPDHARKQCPFLGT